MKYKIVGCSFGGTECGIRAEGTHDIELIGSTVYGEVGLDLKLSEDSSFVSTNSIILGKKIAVLVRDWDFISENIGNIAQKEYLSSAQFSEIISILREIMDNQKPKGRKAWLINHLISFASNTGSGLLVNYIKQLFNIK
ncbi:hypothetical protein HFE03_07375 [Paenibacillus sp. EKM102P]|uniref:hypothetical protein n=1 Tax=unclassified Paenibacillus TaxID=185978 RepID=UPI00142DCFBD|nr:MULTISPECIES: hypothetical protein [unclassified Paenibacillus]KAF6620467.1 hypothetical protein HFE00_05280 [Paenibacillus sp. EKM101P]KAF6623459.1 hypothetical protein HFE03_07375 [Paenibacillus sp. EKM102P]KAF6633979.1 hypothetical protein HFE01_07135 [Paenibacillus sp. EKM10P]KAF6649505.1 hypothetical protein HFE02_02095 [Paenibacillus sp. EKM11P]